MSLDWNIEKVPDFESLYVGSEAEGYRLNRLTDTLFFTTMVVGLGEITKSNLEEWVFRLAVLDTIGEPLFFDTDQMKKRSFTFDELHRHVGLKTNAKRMTRPQFLKHVAEELENKGEVAVEAYRATMAVTA